MLQVLDKFSDPHFCYQNNCDNKQVKVCVVAWGPYGYCKVSRLNALALDGDIFVVFLHKTLISLSRCLSLPKFIMGSGKFNADCNSTIDYSTL